jgi:hypothetical protein
MVIRAVFEALEYVLLEQTVIRLRYGLEAVSESQYHYSTVDTAVYGGIIHVTFHVLCSQ